MNEIQKELVIRRVGVWKWKRAKPKFIGAVGCPLNGANAKFLQDVLFFTTCSDLCGATGCPCHQQPKEEVYTAFWRWASGGAFH